MTADGSVGSSSMGSGSRPGIVDVHVHLTRDVAQERLVFPRPGYADHWRWANGERVDAHLEAEQIDGVVMLNYMDVHRMVESRVAREPEVDLEGLWEEMRARVARFNDWGCELGASNARLVPFMCVDAGLFPEVEGMMAELERCLAQGARGVKIHPGLSRFDPGDRRMWPLYERMQEAELPILSDTGSLTSAPDGTPYGRPVHFIPALEDFPRLRLIMAHMPGAYWDERIGIAARFPSVLFDTAGGFNAAGWSARDGRRACAIEDAERLIRTIGVERVLFGSDAPAHDQRPQIQQILGLSLSEREQDLILGGNAKALLRLGSPARAS